MLKIPKIFDFYHKTLRLKFLYRGSTIYLIRRFLRFNNTKNVEIVMRFDHISKWESWKTVKFLGMESETPHEVWGDEKK